MNSLSTVTDLFLSGEGFTKYHHTPETDKIFNLLEKVTRCKLHSGIIKGYLHIPARRHQREYLTKKKKCIAGENNQQEDDKIHQILPS